MTESEGAKQKIREWFPSTAHFSLFCRVAAWTLIMPVLVRALSLPRLLILLTPARAQKHNGPGRLLEAEFINSYVIMVLRQNPNNEGKMCLRRSLVLYRFLRIYGITAGFRLGVRKNGNALIGHSWIEIDGKKYNDPQADVHYFVTYRFPEDNQTPDRDPREKPGHDQN